jgi:hypothetical protein
MAAHKGPASLRPRCTRSGSSVAAIPVYQSTSLLKRLDASFLPRRPGLYPRPVRMGFMADKVSLGQVSLPVLLFSPVSIPPVLRSHLYQCHCVTSVWKQHESKNGLTSDAVTAPVKDPQQIHIYRIIRYVTNIVCHLLSFCLPC